MPHITDAEKKELETRNVVKMGDACFLFAKFANDQFNASPSWTTIHQIKRALAFPFHNDETHALIQRSMGHMDKIDVQVAADLAFLEFYRLIGSKYEDHKIHVNGNAFVHPPELCTLACFDPQFAQTVTPKRGRGRPKKNIPDLGNMTVTVK